MAEGAANLTIGQVAGRTGLSVHALRFYERQGLLAEPVQRGRNGHRLHRQDDEVASQIRALTESLDAITYKVTIYQDHLDRGSADRLWSTPPAAGNGNQDRGCHPA